MLIIDFKRNPKDSFKHGFAKGICAPLMIFGNFEAPAPRRIDLINFPVISTKNALENDWITIGNDLKKVIALHGKKTTNNT